MSMRQQSKITSRANPAVWRLAEWLYRNILPPWEANIEWGECHQDYKDQLYDKAKELQYMMLYNAFTGPDNHD